MMLWRGFLEATLQTTSATTAKNGDYCHIWIFNSGEMVNKSEEILDSSGKRGADYWEL